MTEKRTGKEPGRVRTWWLTRRSDLAGETRRVTARNEALLERLRTEFGLEPVIQQRHPR